MLVRFSLAAAAVLFLAGQACGQAATNGSGAAGVDWRRAGSPSGSPATTPKSTPTLAAKSVSAASVPKTPSAAGRSVVRVKNGTGTLPNGHGQVWREYDITPYTLRVTSTKRPEQAIVDWILRETGYEAWHSEPLGVLSATKRSLRVYHTPEMQAVVADVVDRFVNSKAETQTFSLRVVTLDNPNWRVKAQRLLHPVTVQTPGIGAWILAKEDMALLLNELRRRTDYREHSSPHMLINNGQSSVVSTMRGRPYIRDVAITPTVWPGFQAKTGQVDEGFTLDFSPLLSADERIIDATIRCNIDQVEKMVPVVFDVPTMPGARQRAEIEVPQVTQFRFHERFRWPVDKVLLVSMGMVALPIPVDAKSKELVLGIRMPGPKTAPRADLLLFVEARGKPSENPRVTRRVERKEKGYHGRY